jgi:RNA polymerase sigma-70 factor (ECF subfamily)
MRIEELDDQRLISLTQKGNKQAFGVLVKRYMRRAYYVALGFVGSHEDALDLSQDAFVRAYRSIKRFELGKQFFTWYYQILRNLCFNLLRKRKKAIYSFSEIPETEFLRIQDDSEGRPDQNYERKELYASVWKAVQNLGELEREIIILREFQELSYQEIAEILKCPVGTVMSRLYYARKKLARELKDSL